MNDRHSDVDVSFIEGITLLSVRCHLNKDGFSPPTENFPIKQETGNYFCCLCVDIACLFVCVYLYGYTQRAHVVPQVTGDIKQGHQQLFPEPSPAPSLFLLKSHTVP